MVLRGSCGMPGSEPGSATCKAKVLPPSYGSSPQHLLLETTAETVPRTPWKLPLSFRVSTVSLTSCPSPSLPTVSPPSPGVASCRCGVQALSPAPRDCSADLGSRSLKGTMWPQGHLLGLQGMAELQGHSSGLCWRWDQKWVPCQARHLCRK